jgi:ABC-type nitrate/sulfonate/bicarbonate transport system substrate-binding protein
VEASLGYIPLNIQMRKEGFNELFYAGKILQRPLTGIAATSDKIRKNPQQVQRMLRAFVRASRALKSERGEFISFAQKKFGYSREVTEEAYTYLVDALAHDGLVDDSVLQNAIDESKSVVNVSKAISRSDVVDYSFLKQAQKQ